MCRQSIQITVVKTSTSCNRSAQYEVLEAQDMFIQLPRKTALNYDCILHFPQSARMNSAHRIQHFARH